MSSAPAFIAIKSILVVDDSVVQRMFAVNLCKEIGIAQTFEAGDGKQALNVLATCNPLPDLVLIDLEMPGMDGVELAQEMYALDLMIPIIVVSARESSTVESAARMVADLGLPLIGALAKPLKRDTLEPLLRRAEEDFG